MTVIDSGRNGCIDTRLPPLLGAMRLLLRDPGLAAEWGRQAAHCARTLRHRSFVAN